MQHYKDEIVSVNGTEYRNLNEGFYKRCNIDDDVLLLREPDNPYDVNAIAVIYLGTKIGYIPRKEAGGRLAHIIDTGRYYTAQIAKITPWKKRDKFRIKISTFPKETKQTYRREPTQRKNKPRSQAFYTQNHTEAIKEAKNKCGIYCIACKNGKSYIGQSKHIGIRWQEHINDLRRGFHSNTSLGRDWAELGARQFRFEVIEECSPSQLDQLEKYHIEQKGSYLCGYNSTANGQAIPDFEKFDIKRKLPKESIITRTSPCDDKLISNRNICEEVLRATNNSNSTNKFAANEKYEIQAKDTADLSLTDQMSLQSITRKKQKNNVNLSCIDSLSVQTKCVSSERSNTRTTESRHTEHQSHQTRPECHHFKTVTTSAVRHFPKKEYSQQQYVNELAKRIPNAEAIVNSREFNEWLMASPSAIREKSKSLDPSDGAFVLRAYERHRAWKEFVQRNKESILSKLRRKISKLRQLF